MKHLTIPLLLISAIISGCVAMGPMPQTAPDYRQGIAAGGYGTSLEVYEIDRAYSNVAETLRNNAKNCLNVALIKTTCINNSCKDHDVKYTSTIVSNSEKTELHVQWRRTPWDSNFDDSAPPADGIYITVADAEPTGTGKTKMTIYGPSIKGLQTVPNAIKHWAAGTNLGCPDLTQTGYY